MAFGEKLKELRKAAKLTQTELANRLALHPQTVSKWERDLSEPDISQLGDLASALGISLECLCGGKEAEETYAGKFEAEKFGRLISERRIACGETQEQLAEAVGISADTISRWERGVSCPDIAKLSALADHFEMPVSRLYYGIGEEERTESIVLTRRYSRLSVVLIAAAAIFFCMAVTLLVIILSSGSRSSFAETQTHTITVDGESARVEAGTSYMPAIPAQEGYDFIGWRDEAGEIVSFPRTIDTDIRVRAVFEPHEYTVEYWLNGGHFSAVPQTVVTIESEPFAPLRPEKEGTEFKGWYFAEDYRGEPVESISYTGEDLVLYAKWEEALCTIRYELNGGVLFAENPSSVSFEESVRLFEPVREGYLFLGWYDGSKGGTRYESVGGEEARNMTLYALWQKSNAVFSVHYDACGGEVTGKNPVSVGAGEVFELFPAVKEAYNFLGWNTQQDGSGVYYDRLYGIEEPLTLYAVYEPKTYLVRYEYEGEYEGGESNPNHIAFGERVELKPVQRFGYIFAGWFDQKTGGNRVDVIDEGNLLSLTVLYARFDPILASVELDGAGGTFFVSSAEKEYYVYEIGYADVLILPECRKQGCIFLGWVDEDGKPISKVNGYELRDRSLTALWQEESYYFISYELGGGTAETPNPERVKFGEVLPLADPVRAGYLFLGWYDDPDGKGERYTSTPAGRTEHLTLYAVWQEIVMSGSIENFTYKKGRYSVTITSYTGPVGKQVDVVFPAMVEGLPVTKIGNDRMMEEAKVPEPVIPMDETLHSLVLPDGVIELGDNAFASLTVALPVEIPSSVQTVGYGCFNFFNGKVLFSQEGDLTEIGGGAFCGVTFDGVLELPYGVRTIGDSAFAEICATGILLPDTVEFIGDFAFSNSNIGRIEEMYLPASVKYIGVEIFGGTIRTPLTNEQLKAMGAGYSYCGVSGGSVKLYDGGSVQTLSGQAVVLPRPEKPGYTFLGWKNKSGEFCSELYFPNGMDEELTAVYEEKAENDGRSPQTAVTLSAGVQYEFILTPQGELYFDLDLSKPCMVRFVFSTGDLEHIEAEHYGESRNDSIVSGTSVDYSPGDLFKLRTTWWSKPLNITLSVWVFG